VDLAVGTDVVDVARVAMLYARGGQSFQKHWFTPAEVAYCAAKAHPARHLAARLAAKESVLKALRFRWHGPTRWHEIEVVHDASGAPQVVLHGSMASCALGVTLAVSLAHEDQWATATVIALRMP
jgi:holo-[acyl-carrier protein] synthase